MKPKPLRVVGIVLLLIGLIGFLFASVGLSSADKVPEISAPKGVEIVRSADDPQVLARKKKAETVLFASLLLGGIGVAALGMGIIAGRRQGSASGMRGR